MEPEEKEIDYLKFIEFIVDAQFITVPLSAEELRLELRRRLTKKELKVLLYIYVNRKENNDDVVAKFNIDNERKDELIESGKRKIRSLASWQRQK